MLFFVYVQMYIHKYNLNILYLFYGNNSKKSKYFLFVNHIRIYIILFTHILF